MSKMVSIVDLMGVKVLVDRVYRRKVNCAESTRTTVCKEWFLQDAEGRPGWIVGERWLQNGVIRYFYGEDVPFEWHRDGLAIHCLLVCYWPTLRPVYVPWENGFRFAASAEKPYPSGYKWNERDRRVQSKIMQDQPRDAKGRWISARKVKNG